MFKSSHKHSVVVLLFVSMVIFNSVSSLFGMERAPTKEESLNMTSLDELSPECIRLAKLLFEQPILEYEYSLYSSHRFSEIRKKKVLALTDYNDAQICEFVFAHVATKIRKGSWYIKSFQSDWRGSLSLKEIKEMGWTLYALELLDNSPINQLCSIEKLHEVCQTVVPDLKKGWQAAQPHTCACGFFNESEVEYYLFINKELGRENYYCQDGALIQKLAIKLGFSGKVTCHDDESSHMQYLWVKKDALEKFNQVFGFGLVPWGSKTK